MTNELRIKLGYNKLKAGEFFMSLEDFKDAFKKFTIVYLNKDWKNSFIEKRNAINKRVYRFNFTITENDLPALL